MITTAGFGGYSIVSSGWGDPGLCVIVSPKKRRRRIVINTVRDFCRVGVRHTTTISSGVGIGFEVVKTSLLNSHVGVCVKEQVRKTSKLSIPKTGSIVASRGIGIECLGSNHFDNRIGILHDKSLHRDATTAFALHKVKSHKVRNKVSKKRLVAFLDSVDAFEDM